MKFLIINIIILKIIYSLPIIFEKSKDSPEISIYFNRGCGYFSIIADSFRYNSSYENPYIENVLVNGDIVILIGANFCDDGFPKYLLLGDTKINETFFISSGHNRLEFSYNNSKLYFSSFPIQLFASEVPSNKMKLTYLPIIEYINNIPRNKNGIIIIKGTRLISNIKHSNIEVRIGSLGCTIITKFSHEITCNLVSIGCNETNLLVNLKIDDIVNSELVYFNFDTPFISSYRIKNDILILDGHCFGNKESIIFNDDIPLIFEDVNVNEEETIMSFTIPKTLEYLNLSVKSYQTKSNYFFIGLSFISKFVTLPLVNGSNCIVKIFNTSFDSVDSPIIIVNPST
ncbi:hypothetical protein RB653_001724 [Dictyostelium firmibasis]|uniref:IPT/TIG domain-containing protein n=1 Tax=Dictyostelium firmibasis TaxID=79012 RepID=A0AAN7TYZ5_9MYCE